MTDTHLQVRWAGDRCTVCDSDVDFDSDQAGQLRSLRHHCTSDMLWRPLSYLVKMTCGCAGLVNSR